MKKKKDLYEARRKIASYFSLAEEVFPKNQEKANDYVRKARRVAMKNRMSLPSVLKRRFCKHCYAFFVPGVSARVRTKNKNVVYYCLSCKKYSKVGYRYPTLSQKG